MSALVAIMLWFFTWPFTTMWRAYIVTVLWGWFVAPVTGFAAPSIYVVAGMMMTLFMILPFQRVPKNDADPTSAFFSNLLVYGLIGPGMILGCGWVWKWLQWGVA